MNKVKDIALFDQCLHPIKTSSSVIKHLEQAFFYVIFFHSHPFNEMFIVNGKSHCCNDTFTDVRFTLLVANRIFKKNTNYFKLLESAFHWLLCLKFSFKLVTFSKSYARKQKCMFFSEHSVFVSV